MSVSSSSSNTSSSNPPDSANNSSRDSRSRSPYGGPVTFRFTAMDGQIQPQIFDDTLSQAESQGRSPFSTRFGAIGANGASRPSTPSLVYIVTSNFASQTLPDGVRLSESDIVGFQILAVFSRIQDANSYAEHECEEIDAGVRRRRRRRLRSGAVGEEGEGIRASANMHDDGTMSWNVEGIGQIEVEQWVVQ